MFFGISCSKDENTMGVHISTVVKISVVDKLNSDLLDSGTANYFESNNIKILHLVNSELQEYFEGHLDVSEGFSISPPNSLGFNKEYVFMLYGTSAYGSADLMPITYIQWNDMDTDTIQCQISRTNSSTVCTKVWFNGNEIWDIDKDNEKRWFKIVK